MVGVQYVQYFYLTICAQFVHAQQLPKSSKFMNEVKRNERVNFSWMAVNARVL